MPRNLQRFLSTNKFSFFLIILGSITWYLTMVKSGLVYSFGMGFWGANGHDGVWHLALASNLARGSFEMPIFAGEQLTNYHIGFDLLLAFLYKITSISLVTWYFQILPICFSLLIGILVLVLLSLWKRTAVEKIWVIFFIYFGGSAGWLINLVRGQEIGGESMFWSQQAISTLINPPFSLSLIFMLAGLVGFYRYSQKRSRISALVSIIAFGVLIQIKAYAGVLVLAALFFSSLFFAVKKKGMSLFYIFGGSLFISLLIFLPLNQSSQNLLVFKPFWFWETMMAVSDRFYWPRFYEAMINWRAAGIWHKAISAYFVAYLIFWYGNLGTRLLGEIYLWRLIVKRKLQLIDVFLISICVFGFIFSTLFVQRGSSWNTIQFFYYSLFVMGIYAGFAASDIMSKLGKRAGRLFLAATIVFTLPTSLTSLKHYLPSTPPSRITHLELAALNFLNEQPNGVVLTYPFDRDSFDEAIAPRPLYKYVSTSYVSAFSQKIVYLEDEVNLDITSYDWRVRKAQVLTFYESLDQDFVYRFLREKNIEYIYWLAGQRARLGESQLGIEKIFENDEVNIYKVIN